MEDIYQKAKEASEFISTHFNCDCKLALVTGSGLDVIINQFEIIKQLAFSEIPHLRASTFHKGMFLLCRYANKDIIVLNGRLHYYEGYSAQEITFPIRILALLGIKNLILTNASGGLNTTYEEGELVLLTDHINLMPEHPLRGKNEIKLGDRFPDMTTAYDLDLRHKLKQIASQENIRLLEGVYTGFQGPSLETPAEYKFLHIIGADMVGMSTVPEVIVANHSGMNVAAVSIVTNICYPPEKVKPTSVDHVIKVANKASVPLSKMINKLIELI